MAIIKPPRPPIACPMKRTRAVSAASRSKVFNRFPVISPPLSGATRAPNKKGLLRIANHGAAKGLDPSALSGLADEPDRLSEMIVMTTHSDHRHASSPARLASNPKNQ